MSVRELTFDPHPILRAAARPVEVFDGGVRRLSRDLIETMYAHDGIGLAAPQIGSSLAVFVANPSQRPGKELVMVNPVMTACRGRASVTEGCLSLPKAWHKVGRAAYVCMTGREPSGREISIEAEGLLAIVLQHEYDHLQGRLFIDRLSWLSRRRVQRAAAAACA
jgi:peptide deformylase